MAPVILACLLVMAGCTSVDGQGRYRVESIGKAQRSIEAVVMSARPAFIQQSTSGQGAAAGGLVGGSLAAESDNAGVIIAGIIGGIIIGEAIESASNVHDATEYVIRTSANALFTVAQVDRGNLIFKKGDEVILVYGYPSRLIANNG
jgi:outer membrane lipoprotein SlyB